MKVRLGIGLEAAGEIDVKAGRKVDYPRELLETVSFLGALAMCFQGAPGKVFGCA